MPTDHTQPVDATPIHDTGELKLSHLLRYEELDIAEANNNYRALNKYLGKSKPPPAWTDPSYLQQLHHDMFCDVWKWAGKYRKNVTNIGVKPYQIPEEIGKLCDDIALWELPILEQAVRIHHRLVWIHPFENGNGRHARLASDLFLAHHKHPSPRWQSHLSTIGSARKQYIVALEAADRGDLEPLLYYIDDLCTYDKN